MRGHLSRWLALAAFAIAACFVLAAASPAGALSTSMKVLLVPSAGGEQPHGGMLPTSGFPTTVGFPSGSPTFATTTTADIRGASTDPLQGYDTVLLDQVCAIDTYLANATFKTRLEQFVFNGGKLIIWDSECVGTDYSKFVYPFTTNNPGAMGAHGTLTDLEANSLSDTDPLSPAYVDLARVEDDTDAVGDANVMTSQDPHWYVDMTATNYNNVTGPVHTYARYGSGLIIYNGLDQDVLDDGVGFDPASTWGVEQLARIWMLELLQPWNPDNLQSQVKVFGLALTPLEASLPVGQAYTAHAHASANTIPQKDVEVTFTVTAGPNAGITGKATTDENGDASFTYIGLKTGTDTVTASAVVDGTATTETATVTWTGTGTAAPGEKVDGIFLCYSVFQSNPGVWAIDTARELLKQGYWTPYAVAGRVEGGTNIADHHLVCNLAAGQSAGERFIGAGADTAGADAHSAVAGVIGWYPIVGS